MHFKYHSQQNVRVSERKILPALLAELWNHIPSPLPGDYTTPYHFNSDICMEFDIYCNKYDTLNDSIAVVTLDRDEKSFQLSASTIENVESKIGNRKILYFTIRRLSNSTKQQREKAWEYDFRVYEAIREQKRLTKQDSKQESFRDEE